MMKLPYKIIMLSAIAIIPFVSLKARPRYVNLDVELHKASYIGLVVIDKYDSKGQVYYHSIEFKDTMHIAKAGSYGRVGVNWRKPNPRDLTGYTPVVKDTVLIVLDSNKTLSLFAKQLGPNFRFWSPYFTGQKAMFTFKEPAALLEGSKDSRDWFPKPETYACWDGCLLPREALGAYKKQ